MRLLRAVTGREGQGNRNRAAPFRAVDRIWFTLCFALVWRVLLLVENTLQIKWRNLVSLDDFVTNAS